MNWQEIASSVINALRNAGVKKDVIDLQEKQVAIFRDEIAVLARKFEQSESQRTSLEVKIVDLEKQLESLNPIRERLDEIEERLLVLFARAGRAPALEQVGAQLGLKQVEANHYANKLVAEGMIECIGHSPQYGTMYLLTAKGTAYVVENKLV
jgi:hypothetical protein